jgi:hypothetical protein
MVCVFAAKNTLIALQTVQFDQNRYAMKNQFQKSALFTFIALMMLSACKKADNSDDTDNCGPADEFPFMVTGHELTYTYEEFLGGSGDYTHTYGEQDSDGNFKISLSGNPKPSALTDIDFFYYRACGNKFLGGLTPGSGSSNWQYKANAQVGEYWTHAIEGGGTVTFKVLETGLTVSTIAGAIPDCAKITYNQTGAPNTDTIFWSDQVGWVKYDGVSFDYELKLKNF